MYAWFLANWAQALSWTETARRFRTSWHVVFDAVRHSVEWGKAHRDLDGITAIGVDELSWKKGHKYLTLVYQVDQHCRRLLWIGRDRTAKTFERFFEWLGKERTAALKFVVSDMWKAFLSTVAQRANAANSRSRPVPRHEALQRRHRSGAPSRGAQPPRGR
jgi:transposase